jgi:hypothetical protein
MASADEEPAVPAANPNGIVQRVARLLAPRPNAAAFAVGSGLSALLILALPFLTLFVSLGRGA